MIEEGFLMIEQIKKLLGLIDSDNPSEEEERRDELIAVIVDNTTLRLRNLLGGVSSVPDELKYIVTEVSVKRYNRIGSEGAATHSVEGESLSFSDNDFSEFSDDIQAWRDTQEEVTKGKLRFL